MPQTIAGRVAERVREPSSMPPGRQGKQILTRREGRCGRTRPRTAAWGPRLEGYQARCPAAAGRPFVLGRLIPLLTPQVEMRSLRTGLLRRQPWASVRTDGRSQAPGEPPSPSMALRLGATTAVATAAAPAPRRRLATSRRQAPRLPTWRAATRGHAHPRAQRSLQREAWRPRSIVKALPPSTTVTACTQAARLGTRLAPRLLALPTERNSELLRTTIRLRAALARRGSLHKLWPGALVPVLHRALHFAQDCPRVLTCWSPSLRLTHAGVTPDPDPSQG